MQMSSKQFYNEVQTLMNGPRFKDQYTEIKSAMETAKRNNDASAFHANRKKLVDLRARIIYILGQSKSNNKPAKKVSTNKFTNVNAEPGRNQNNGGKSKSKTKAASRQSMVNTINSLQKEYDNAVKLQQAAKNAGNAELYNMYRTTTQQIKLKLLARKKEMSGSDSASNQSEIKLENLASNLLNSSEEVAIPVSGSEPVYTTRLWNTKAGIGKNNCYSYAFNNFDIDRTVKAVPGDRSGFEHDLDYKTCKRIKERLLQDNPDSIYHEPSPDRPCMDNFSRIMMFVGERDTNTAYGDFHFYKQHKDIEYEVQPKDTIESIAQFLETDVATVIRANKNSTSLRPGSRILFANFKTRDGFSLWSHKLGWATGALLTDSCGKIIKDPRSACRTYSVNYKRFCGSYCIRNDVAKTS